jgi:ATP-dependent Clp protease ATP-binding subunit ClpB
VGKTELCKALAAFLFDTEDALVRVDMSEFMEKHSVSRLIGAPPGYVGYEEGGYLTEAVKRKPYAVILLDEIEKAHADVFNVLLQVLDEGRLTDGQGQTVDFRNTVIVLTSNLGSTLIQGYSDDENYLDMKKAVMDVVAEHFRPEFINRIDETIVFHSLGKEQIRAVTAIQVDLLIVRLAAMGIELVVSERALDHLAASGFDPVYGVRPLKRTIQKQLENSLAEQLLAGVYATGDVINCDFIDDQYSFNIRV